MHSSCNNSAFFNSRSLADQSLLLKRGGFFSAKAKKVDENGDLTKAVKKLNTEHKTKTNKLDRIKRLTERNFKEASESLKKEYEKMQSILLATQTLGEINQIEDEDIDFTVGIGAFPEAKESATNTGTEASVDEDYEAPDTRDSGKRKSKKQLQKSTKTPKNVDKTTTTATDNPVPFAALFAHDNANLMAEVLSFLPLQNQLQFRLQNHSCNQLVRRKVLMHIDGSISFIMWKHFRNYRQLDISTESDFSLHRLDNIKVESLITSSSTLNLSSHPELTKLTIRGGGHLHRLTVVLPPKLEELNLLRGQTYGAIFDHYNSLDILAESVPTDTLKVLRMSPEVFSRSFPRKFMAKLSGLRHSTLPLDFHTADDKILMEEFMDRNRDTLETVTLAMQRSTYNTTTYSISSSLVSMLKGLKKLKKIRVDSHIDESGLSLFAQINEGKEGKSVQTLHVRCLVHDPIDAGFALSRTRLPIRKVCIERFGQVHGIGTIGGHVTKAYEFIHPSNTERFTINEESLRNVNFPTWWNNIKPSLKELTVIHEWFHQHSMSGVYEIISGLDSPPPKVVIQIRDFQWNNRNRDTFEKKNLSGQGFGAKDCDTLFSLRVKSRHSSIK